MNDNYSCLRAHTPGNYKVQRMIRERASISGTFVNDQVEYKLKKLKTWHDDNKRQGVRNLQILHDSCEHVDRVNQNACCTVETKNKRKKR